MKICEVTLLEAKLLDTSEYGGWITPDRKVYYVKPYKHEDFAIKYLNEIGKKFDDAAETLFRSGWVRFHTEDFESMGVFSVDGKPAGLKATYKVWAPTAMRAEEVYLDDWRFNIPRDRAKLIKKFT